MTEFSELKELESYRDAVNFMAETKWEQAVEADRLVTIAKTDWLKRMAEYDRLIGQYLLTCERIEEARANLPQPVVSTEVYMVDDGLVIATARTGYDSVEITVDKDDRE